MNRGRFIVLEGIDASGKSTQMKLLKRYFSKTKNDVIFTREPSSGPIGQIIRLFYLSGRRKDHCGIINKLCELDRIDHILNEKNGMLKMLNDGKHVICDRYILSTIAYSLYKELNIEDEIFSQKVLKIFNRLLENKCIVPDLIIFIKVNPKIANDRIVERNENLSVFENKISKLYKIDESYNKVINILLKNNLCNIITINGENPKSQVLDDILTRIHRVFNKDKEN